MASCDDVPPDSVIIVKAAGVTLVRVCLEEREGVKARHDGRRRRGREKVTVLDAAYWLLVTAHSDFSAVEAKAKKRVLTSST